VGQFESEHWVTLNWISGSFSIGTVGQLHRIKQLTTAVTVLTAFFAAVATFFAAVLIFCMTLLAALVTVFTTEDTALPIDEAALLTADVCSYPTWGKRKGLNKEYIFIETRLIRLLGFVLFICN
jgi:hypothetical protein